MLESAQTDTQIGLIRPVEPKREIEDVLRNLIDKLFYIVLTLGSLAFVANMGRMVLHGWHPGYLADIGTFVLILSLLAARRCLPVPVVFWVLVALVAIEGIFSLLSLGLASSAMFILTSLCILIGIFQGLRTGLVASALVLATMAAVFCARRAGLVGPLPDVEAFIRSPSTWITQGLTFVAYAVSVVFAANGVQRRLVDSLRDLDARTSELRTAYVRHRASEKKYRVLTENIADLVFVQDIDLRVVYLSSAVERMFGYTAEEAADLGLGKVMAPSSLERIVVEYGRYLEEARRGPVDVPLQEAEYVRKDGTTFWGEMRVAFLHDEQGNVTGSQGTLRDVSERKRAEEEHRELQEQLRQSEKMQVVGQLAGGVAHDFNNQLSAIMGFADLIRHDESASEVSREYARNIVQAARRSAELTSKLLAFARKGKYQTVPVDVHAVITETVAVLERSIDKAIRIRQHLDAVPHITAGDPAQLESALLNLGLNARDAMPEGGELLFATSVVALDAQSCATSSYELSPGDYIEVKVVDTGVGMDAGIARHIFEPFFTTKALGRGTGMGLAAVDGTVRNHHGAIQLESVVGQGTSFCVYLPVVALESIGEDSGETMAVNAPAASKVVLVVDDEELVCRMACELVRRLGYVARPFTAPLEALEYYRANWRSVDLAIVDLLMPDMNGKDLLAALRTINPDAVVLICSGHSEKDDAQRALGLGAFGFVRKPFTLPELSREVARAVA